MNNYFTLLAIGDVVGPAAVKHINEKLWAFRREHKIDMVVCNAENAAIGNGLDPQSADTLLASGCDALTSGNHIFKKREIRSYLENSLQLVRPANYPSGVCGNGYTIINVGGVRVLVINVLGVIYLDALACPFDTVERILAREIGRYDLSVLDIHAEATSEKIALGHYFDGRINVIFGTHTHVPTADEIILSGGSGYVTDLGMTGVHDSVLGVRSDIIIEKLKTKLPVRFELAEGDIAADCVIFKIDLDTNKVTEVKRTQF